nr:hypothetical protein [uncultured Methanospirillum sp.]
MRTSIIIVLMLTGLLIMPLEADIAVTGMKQQTYQYIINNTEAFPDYQFLTSSEIWNYEYPSLVINGTFGGGYKLDGFVLHAIRQNDLDPVIRAELSSSDHEKKNLSAYFESAPMATSDLLLPVATTLNETLAIRNLTVLLRIDEISNRTMNVTRLKTVYQYENGTSSEEFEQSKPEENNSDALNDINQMFSPDTLLEKI